MADEIPIQNELLFDEKFNEMENTDIYIAVFGEFFKLVLKYTNINYKFNTLVKKYKMLKRCEESIESSTVELENEVTVFDIDVDDEFYDLDDCYDIDEGMNDLIIDETVDESCRITESISQSSCVFESQPTVMTEPFQLGYVTVNDLLQDFRPIEYENFMAYVGLLIISGSLNLNKLSLKDLFKGIGGLHDFKKTMRPKEYMTIRQNLIFHDIRKDKDYEKTMKEIMVNMKIRDLGDLAPIKSRPMSLQNSSCYSLKYVQKEESTNGLVEKFQGQMNLMLEFMNNFNAKIVKKINKAEKQKKKNDKFLEVAQLLTKVMHSTDRF